MYKMETSGADKNMVILVKRAEGKRYIEVDKTATVKDLKEKVLKCFGSPLEQLCLTFAEKTLKDEETLEQHDIKHGLVVYRDISVPDKTQMETSGADKMTILVKMAEEKRYIEIDVKAKVKDLKEKVSECLRSPLEQLRLTFAGKTLEDEETLEQHRIKDGLEVNLDIIVPNYTQLKEKVSECFGSHLEQLCLTFAEKILKFGDETLEQHSIKHGLDVYRDISVPDKTQLKEKVSEECFESLLEQLCLTFAEKTLKDEETLKQHGIKHGLVVYVDISVPDNTQAQPAVTPAVDQPASGVGQSSTPQPGPGLGSSQEDRALSQMMETVQQMTSNLDMQQIIRSHPSMREFTERNPGTTHKINNPVAVQQTMELARNPAMLREWLKSQDGAMNYIGSIPGGRETLQQLWQDAQGLMMNSASGAAVDVPRAPQETYDKQQQEVEQQLQELKVTVTPQHEDSSGDAINTSISSYQPNVYAEEEKEEEMQQLKTPIQEETQ